MSNEPYPLGQQMHVSFPASRLLVTAGKAQRTGM